MAPKNFVTHVLQKSYSNSADGATRASALAQGWASASGAWSSAGHRISPCVHTVSVKPPFEPHLDGTADSLALLRWGGCGDL